MENIMTSSHEKSTNYLKHRLTDRDLQVVELLKDYKMLTTSQIQQLLYPSKQKTQTRLLLLYKQKLVKRFPYPVLIKDTGKGEYVYHLKKQTGNTLLKLQHHIKLNDLRIIFEKTFKQKDEIRLVDFIPEYSGKIKISTRTNNQSEWKPNSNTYNNNGIEIIPDATIVLENTINKKKALFFLELDLGSEQLFSKNNDQYALFSKIQKYSNYKKQNNYTQFNTLYNYSFKGFRVLLIMNKISRIEKIISTINRHKIYKLIWITSISELTQNSIKDKIWTTTSDSKTTDISNLNSNQSPNQNQKYSIITD